MNLTLCPGLYAVCRLPADAPVPPGILDDAFSCAIRTEDELSLVVREHVVQDPWRTEAGWRILRVAGPLDFSLVGILAGLTDALAQAGVSIFALSTFNTDYLLIKETDVDLALIALERASHTVDDQT